MARYQRTQNLVARYWVLGFPTLSRVVWQWPTIGPALDSLARHLLGAAMYLLRPVARSFHSSL